MQYVLRESHLEMGKLAIQRMTASPLCRHTNTLSLTLDSRLQLPPPATSIHHLPLWINPNRIPLFAGLLHDEVADIPFGIVLSDGAMFSSEAGLE